MERNARSIEEKLLTLSTLTRDEMRQIGEPDGKPPIDVCAGISHP
jgi:hypothetical protein